MSDWGETVSEIMIKKQLQETIYSTLLLVCFYLLCMLYSDLTCMYCHQFEVVLCVILLVWPVYCWRYIVWVLPYVYLLYCVCIAVFYFRCRTAG